MYKFSDIADFLIEEILKSRNSIKIAVAWFTNISIYEAISTVQDLGVEVSLIVINDRINNKKFGVDFQKIIDKGGKFYFSEAPDLVHHKFCIIDDKVVITGSYNWTYYAELRNWENVIVLDDAKIVNGYILEFKKIELNHDIVMKVSESANKTNVVEKYFNLKEEDHAQEKIIEMSDISIKSTNASSEAIRMESASSVINTRNKIVEEVGNKIFKYCPFEIGILYRKGYKMAVPAHEKLPFKIKKGGSTVIDNQTSIHVIIQKFDKQASTILELHLGGMQKSPKATNKIEHTFHVGLDGYLDLTCDEIGGNATTRARINLRDWM